MADKAISDLTEKTSSVDADLILITDSEVSSDKSKKLQKSNLFKTVGNIEQSDDGYIKNENAYISAGETKAAFLGTNIYYSNGAYTYPGSTAGSFIVLTGNDDFAFYTHNGATNTLRMVYDVSDSQLEITGGLTTTGNVGINITNPSVPLHVKKASTGASNIIVDGNGAGSDARLYLYEDGTQKWNIYNDVSVDSGTLRFNSSVYGSDFMQFRPGTGTIYLTPAYTTTVGGTNRDLFIDSSGVIGYVSSALKYKENVVEYAESEFIYALRPVSFDYKDKLKGIGKVGLIADEVELVNPNICSYEVNQETEEIEVETVNYKELIIPMLKELQKLRAEVDELKGITKDRSQYTVDYIEQEEFWGDYKED